MIASSLIYIIVLTLASFVALLVFIAALSRHRKAMTGDVDLIGATAVVEITLEPEGAVLVRGELWRARSHTGTQALRGESVLVVGASGHLLRVEPAL